eukprot:scaffold247852_cov32-Prasinocladus_malaysianus.AAC.1
MALDEAIEARLEEYARGALSQLLEAASVTILPDQRAEVREGDAVGSYGNQPQSFDHAKVT